MAMSEAQRRKKSEQMKAFWAQKRSQNQNPRIETNQASMTPGVPAKEPESRETVAEELSLQDLQKQIEELKQNQFSELIKALRGEDDVSDVKVNAGKLTGTVEKYITSAERYPDPSERLKNEGKL